MRLGFLRPATCGLPGRGAGSRREFIATLALHALAWGVVLDTKRVSREVSRSLAARLFPYPLRGLRVDLLPHTREIERRPKLSVPSPPPRGCLLLVSSDRCSAAAKCVPQWLGLVSTSDWPPFVELWLLTFDNSVLFAPLVTQAKRLSIPFRLLRVEDRNTLPTITGIVSTPRTLLLDHDYKIVLVSAGPLDRSQTSCFSEHLLALSSFSGRVAHPDNTAPMNTRPSPDGERHSNSARLAHPE
jgi:hypothetical protein